MPLVVATHRLLKCAIYPMYCAKVNVRTDFRKGYMGRELAIHYCSQGRRCQQIASSSFSHGTELQDHTTLDVPRPNDAVPHSALRSRSKSRAYYERTQTSDSPNDLFSPSGWAPHPHRRTTESHSLWPRKTAPVTTSSVARLPWECHTP